MKCRTMIIAGMLLSGCAAHTAPNNGGNGGGSMPPAGGDVSETSKDGKTYVFGSQDDMAAFSNGKPQAIQRQSDITDANKQPVVIEAADDADYANILARYKAQHGMK